jgi:hypothetical protein
MKHLALFTALAVCLSGSAAPAQTVPPNSQFRVKLLSPISTKTSKKGDKITAQVLTPADFQGDMVEGSVKESKGGNKMKGQSVLNFTFETLNHKGANIPVQSSVESVANSQGKQNVDEEGRVISKKNNLGKAALGAGAGALIGAIAGGAKGAAIGAGVGAAAAIMFIELGTSGPEVTFAAGSEFTLSVKERH